jgi:hypothetical protein
MEMEEVLDRKFLTMSDDMRALISHHTNRHLQRLVTSILESPTIAASEAISSHTKKIGIGPKVIRTQAEERALLIVSHIFTVESKLKEL